MLNHIISINSISSVISDVILQSHVVLALEIHSPCMNFVNLHCTATIYYSTVVSWRYIIQFSIIYLLMLWVSMWVLATAAIFICSILGLSKCLNLTIVSKYFAKCFSYYTYLSTCNFSRRRWILPTVYGVWLQQKCLRTPSQKLYVCHTIHHQLRLISLQTKCSQKFTFYACDISIKSLKLEVVIFEHGCYSQSISI